MIQDLTSQGARLLYAEGGSTWLMAPDRFAALAATAEARINGTQPRASAPNAYTSGSRGGGATSVIPIRGVIGQRPGWFTDTATTTVSRSISEAVSSQSISRVILDVDSPGGSVFGVRELADQIRAARCIKPIIAVANSMAASAAYWIASAASEIFITPGGQVGSVGVWSAHVDVSRALDKAGYTVSLVFAAPFKVEGHPYAPLESEARAAMQREVDAYYGMFLDAVAAGRGVKRQKVEAGFGQGRMVLAKDALVAGMVDGIATLDSVIAGQVSTGRAAKLLAAAGRQRTLAAHLDIESAEADAPGKPRPRAAAALLALEAAERD